MGTLVAPVFTQRVPVQFFAPDAPSLNITGTSVLQNNPERWNINTGSVGKTEPGLDGCAYYRGDGELPPFSIDLIWKAISMTDYLKLANLRPYFVHMVSFRNLGYYGKLVLAGPQASAGNTADIVSVKSSFYPLTPSDYGGAQSVARMTAPAALTVTQNAANTGYMATAQTMYYWITFSTKYGETTSYAGSQAITNNLCSVSLGWTWPTTTAYCTQATVYCNTVNNLTTSRICAQVPNGLAPTWTDYVGYSGTTVTQAVPSTNTAYRGQWMGGVWFSETP